MTEKERAAIKADDEIVKNARLGDFIEGYALGYRNIVKSLLYIWGGCTALVVMKTMDADASMVSIIAALSFGTSVLPVYQSLCPHSSFKQKAHLHQNKARQILN